VEAGTIQKTLIFGTGHHIVLPKALVVPFEQVIIDIIKLAAVA
jgi:hypothetical protein